MIRPGVHVEASRWPKQSPSSRSASIRPLGPAHPEKPLQDPRVLVPHLPLQVQRARFCLLSLKHRLTSMQLLPYRIEPAARLLRGCLNAHNLLLLAMLPIQGSDPHRCLYLILSRFRPGLPRRKSRLHLLDLPSSSYLRHLRWAPVAPAWASAKAHPRLAASSPCRRARATSSVMTRTT